MTSRPHNIPIPSSQLRLCIILRGKKLILAWVWNLLMRIRDRNYPSSFRVENPNVNSFSSAKSQKCPFPVGSSMFIGDQRFQNCLSQNLPWTEERKVRSLFPHFLSLPLKAYLWLERMHGDMVTTESHRYLTKRPTEFPLCHYSVKLCKLQVGKPRWYPISGDPSLLYTPALTLSFNPSLMNL